MKTFATLALVLSLGTLALGASSTEEQQQAAAVLSRSFSFGSFHHHVPNVLLSRAAAVPLTPFKIRKNNADIAHGVLMGIAVVLLLPIGALVMRMSHSRNLIRVHIFCQIFGLVVIMAGFGTGVYTSIIHAEIYTDPHTFFGTVICAFFLVQPFFGLLHHLGWVRKQARTIWSYVHVWFGRAVLILAVVDGGYGILYANNAVSGQEGYGTVAGIVGVVYIAVAAFWYNQEELIAGENAVAAALEAAAPHTTSQVVDVEEKTV